MASAIYPLEPGSKYGPCAGTCSHTDCAKQREDAAQECPICGAPIGYENRTYYQGKLLVHALCLETKNDLLMTDLKGLNGIAWEKTRATLAANFTKPK